MPTSQYATADDLRAYTGRDSTSLPDDEANHALIQSSFDVDILLRIYPWPDPPLPSGRRVDPTTLSVGEATGINRVTCAQAEYRLLMGDKFFVRPQYSQATGGPFTVKGRLPYYGPKVRRELLVAGLSSPMTRARSTGRPLGRRIPPGRSAGWPPVTYPWDT